jgi:1,4-dihydroxy-2-naphthoyl-CoA hydrolase
MTIQEINDFCKNSLIEHLDIRFTEVGEGLLVAQMPVHPSTHQPMGYLHGGASLALAETVGSAGSVLITDLGRYNVFGTQVSGNHVATARDGYVVATGRLVHKGRTMHIWDIEIRDHNGKLISMARVTNAIVEKRV